MLRGWWRLMSDWSTRRFNRTSRAVASVSVWQCQWRLPISLYLSLLSVCLWFVIQKNAQRRRQQQTGTLRDLIFYSLKVRHILFLLFCSIIIVVSIELCQCECDVMMLYEAKHLSSSDKYLWRTYCKKLWLPKKLTTWLWYLMKYCKQKENVTGENHVDNIMILALCFVCIWERI